MNEASDINSLWFLKPGVVEWIMPLMILDVVLKGFALWQAAKRKQLYWFIALLVVNSLGILPGIYLYLYYGKQNNK